MWNTELPFRGSPASCIVPLWACLCMSFVSFAFSGDEWFARISSVWSIFLFSYYNLPLGKCSWYWSSTVQRLCHGVYFWLQVQKRLCPAYTLPYISKSFIDFCFTFCYIISLSSFFYIKSQTFSGVLFFCSVICWESSFLLLILLHSTPNQRVISCLSLWEPLKNSIRQFVHIMFFPESILLCSTVCPRILHPPVSAFMFLGLCACMMVHDDAKIFVCLSCVCHIMCDETENIDSSYFMGLFQNSWVLWISVLWMLGIFCLCISSIWLAFL